VQGAGKTTLLRAVLNKCKPNTAANDDAVSEEVIADGLCYCDSSGINMQVFHFPLFLFVRLLLFIEKRTSMFFISEVCLLYRSNYLMLTS